MDELESATLVEPDLELDALLEAERIVPREASVDPEAVWRGLEPLLPVAAAASAGAGGATGGTVVSKALLAKVSATTFVFGLAAGAVGHKMVADADRSSREVPAVVSASATPPEPVGEPAAEPDPAPSSAPLGAVQGEEPSPSVRSPTAPRRRSEEGVVRKPLEPPAAQTSLDSERELIDVARAALAGRRWADAADALSRHERDFAGGAFAEDRDALRLILDAEQGELDERLRARFTRFAGRYPDSTFLPRLRMMIDRKRGSSVTDEARRPQ